MGRLTRGRGRGVWVWRDYLLTRSARPVTMDEGNTPVIKAPRLGRELGLRNLYLKLESKNPLGSFIDRGAATLVTAAIGFNFRKIAVASLGDLGISVVAYSRRAGLRPYTYIPKTAITSKIYQTLVLSHRTVLTENYKEAVKRVRGLSEVGFFPGLPSNPYLLDGYRTLYYELHTQLRRLDYILIPFGDGALLSMTWNAMREVGGESTLIGVRGCGGSQLLRDIVVEKPLFSDLISEAVKETGGYVIEVCDDDVLKTVRELARYEGLIPEPVSVATVAALTKILSKIDSKEVVVSIISGSLLKDAPVLRLLLSERETQVIADRVGSTKLRILEVVSTHPGIHPYAIWKILTRAYGLKISLRAVYQHVEDLEELGLITALEEVRVKGRKRKTYLVTEKGLSLLK